MGIRSVSKVAVLLAGIVEAGGSSFRSHEEGGKARCASRNGVALD
jgi:hypothetical protein